MARALLLTASVRRGEGALYRSGAYRRWLGGKMRHRVSKELFSYWNALRGARAAPERAHIDPAAIRHILADAFILEVDADSRFPIRFSGARVGALWQAEQRGGSFVDLWRNEHRRSIRSAVAMVTDGAAPVVAGAASGDGLQTRLELLLLPLRHFGKTHARVFGALSPACRADDLGAAYGGPLDLISMRVVDTWERPCVSSADANIRPRLRLIVDH